MGAYFLQHADNCVLFPVVAATHPRGISVECLLKRLLIFEAIFSG